MFGIKQVAMALMAGGALLTATGCGKQSRAERALNEKDRMIRQLEEDKAITAQREAEARALAAQATAQNELLGKQVHAVTVQNAQQTAALRQQLSSMQTDMAALQKKLEAAGGPGSVSVVDGGSKEPGAITIRVANTVLFDAGRATLKPGAERTLAEVAATLNGQYANHYVRVEGHTDSTPIVRETTKKMFNDNMELSQSRSKAVYDWLIGGGKVGSSRLYTAGYGYSQPVVWPEKSAEDKAKNRRVDIVILPNNVKVNKEHLASR